MAAQLLRAGVQRLRRRDWHGFHAVDVFLDLVQQGARFGWNLGLRLFAFLSGSRHVRGVVFTQQGFIAAYAGHEVTGQADKLVIAIENDADALLLALTATRLNAVEIIPAIGMESVGQQGLPMINLTCRRVIPGRNWSIMSCVTTLPCWMSIL